MLLCSCCINTQILKAGAKESLNLQARISNKLLLNLLMGEVLSVAILLNKWKLQRRKSHLSYNLKYKYSTISKSTGGLFLPTYLYQFHPKFQDLNNKISLNFEPDCISWCCMHSQLWLMVTHSTHSQSWLTATLKSLSTEHWRTASYLQ